MPTTLDTRDLIRENESLKLRLAEAEATLDAISHGSVDALVVTAGKDREEVRVILDMGYLGDSLFNQVAQPIFILDHAYRIVRSNGPAQLMCGRNPTSLPFSEAVTLLPTLESDFPVPDELAADWIGEGKHLSALEVCHQHPLRGMRYYLLDANPVALSWEGVQGGMVTLVDITERKLAEIQSSVMSGQLRQQFTFMKSISDNIAEGLILVDEDQKVIFQNPAASQMMQIPESEAAGEDVTEVFRIESEAGGRLSLDWTDPGVVEGAARRAWVRGRNGSRTPVQYSIYPIKDGEKLRGNILVVGNISERLTSERQLHLSMEKQQQSQKMEAIGRLAGGIAHDFNNLLLVILGFTDMILQQPGLDPAVEDSLREVRKAGEKAASLTGQLLAYSRKQVLAPKLRPINEAVLDIRKMIGRFVGDNIHVDLDLTPEILEVEIDLAKLQQVLVNMILNAKDAMPDGGTLSIRTGRMETSGRDRSGMAGEIAHESGDGVPPGSYAYIEIQDTGSGMSEAVMERLFEPFFTTKEFGKGSGLGLSTAYGIVLQLGGHLQVFSEVGKGSRFRVILPLAKNQSFPSVPAKSANLPSQMGAGKVVLLVEDEDMVRRLLARLLKENGFTVLEARNGEDALAKLPAPETPIDLVVTDLLMAGMGGIELAKRLAEVRPGLEILFISGYREDQYNMPLIAGQPPYFVAKPFGPSEFLAKIRSILEKKWGN
ncbi:MAG: domain S-box-containing protein [Fibrobacteres bacterium]|nr:domain S-box-containing protein [Fibrobacterota bacterium]